MPWLKLCSEDAVNNSVDHAEDRDPTMLLRSESLAFREHREWDVEVSFWDGPELFRQVLDACPVMPRLPW